MWKWPEEVIEWLKKNTAGRTTKELTELINQQGYDKKYGMIFTESIIKGAKSRYGLKSGTPSGNPKGYSAKYPKGMEVFIKSIAEGKSTAELVEAVNDKFGSGTIGIRQMKAYKKNHGINTGLTGQFEPGHIPVNKGKKMSAEVYAKAAPTMFKKGDIPANHMNIGEYTHTTEGYLVRKVQEQGTQWERFEFVHRKVWKEHNGPIPEGKMVSFLDGDKDNCNIDNLVLIDNHENLELNRSKLRFSEAEFTKAGLAVAKVKIAVQKKKGKKAQNDYINKGSD